MRELGPTMRLLIDGAAVAYAVDDPAVATVLLKRLAQGLAFVDLAPPAHREDADRLIHALRERVGAEFEAWLAEIAAPPAEIAFAVGRFEANGVRVAGTCARALTPGPTPVETAMALVLDAARQDPVFERDVIVRDIGWTLAKIAFGAARERSSDLRALELSALA